MHLPLQAAALAAHPGVAALPLGPVLARLAVEPTGLTSAGWPYLEPPVWERFRDHVPHLFRMGRSVVEAADAIEAAAPAALEGEASQANARRACRVFRQVAATAAITAPPDLWLLRHVLGAWCELGLLRRLLDGAAVYPASCQVTVDGRDRALDSAELEADVHFLLARGLVEQYDDSFRIAGHPRVRACLAGVGPVPAPAGMSATWRGIFAGETLDRARVETVLDLVAVVPARSNPTQNHWVATLDEVELGYRLVPIVLALRAVERTTDLVAGRVLTAAELSPRYPRCAAGALEILGAAGWLDRRGEEWVVHPLGERGLGRGPGPFGIIEAYHPYLARARQALLEGRGGVHVERAANIGASQDANRRTFERANDALDRFCADTGFTYGVFVEHAIGRGEATRQRFDRSGAALSYVGADLEDAAIDAAAEQRRLGVLPADMVLVRQADIGRPEILVQAMRAAGLDPQGAVMVVGNGFHAVRDQDDERMTAVFAGYQAAGIVLLFTEESALSVDDLRATAWNTYHAGFAYVHEKSGQGLRPADPGPSIRLGRPLGAAWSECASRAGYVRADRWCVRSRTVYPTPPRAGYNPASSVGHFFVPAAIAARLGL